MNHRSKIVAAGLGVLLLGLGAGCGDDTTASTTATTASGAPATTTTVDPHQDHHGAEPMEVTIEGMDYAFDDVPESVPAGSRLGFANTSTNELHEMIVFRLPDDVDTPVAELVRLPKAELEATLGAPVTVMLQPPGAPEPIIPVGDGVLTEPGRYALMCFIPVGADPAEYMAAAAAAGGKAPTGVAGGPPHFLAGMYAEVTVL